MSALCQSQSDAAINHHQLRLFGEGHWCHRWLNRLCEIDPALPGHIREQSPDYVHYLCLVHIGSIQLTEYRQIPEPALAHLLRQSSRKAVLRQLYELCPPGLVGILPKLGPDPLTRNDYLRLLELLNDAQARKYLLHAKRIQACQLHWLERLPPHLRCQPVMYQIRKSADFKRLQDLLNTLGTELPEIPVAQFVRLIRTPVKRAVNNMPWIPKVDYVFPPPPWPGNEWIKPVTGAAELREVALRFKNCVFSYAQQVAAGKRYIYVSEKGPALVSIHRYPDDGWAAEEIAGIGNAGLPLFVRLKIALAFNRANLDTSI